MTEIVLVFDGTFAQAQRHDAAQILALQKSAYHREAQLYPSDTLPPLTQTLEEMLADFKTHVFYILLKDGVLVSSVKVRIVDNSAEIGRLIVDPQLQGQGLGSAMLSLAESKLPRACRVKLFTGSQSTRNIAFYEKRGYRRAREQRVSDTLSLIHFEKFHV